MENKIWKTPNYSPVKEKAIQCRSIENRMPVGQRITFSVGHVLNDLVLAAWVSYIIIIQTKVIGLSPKTSGYIWLAVCIADCFAGLAVGYVCDHVNIPYLSNCYGKRKAWHLMGTIVVAGTFPFLMMPCLYCADNTKELELAIYYTIVFIIFMTAWDMVQTTHMTLIPQIARRASEMVELNAARSGCTYASGIFMYAITWILLGEDSQNSLSRSQWKDFMYLSLIVVGIGCFFCLIFHVGTREVSIKGKTLKDYKIYREAIRRAPSAILPLQSLAGDLFPFEVCKNNEESIGFNERSDPGVAEEHTKTEPQCVPGDSESLHAIEGFNYQHDSYKSKNISDCFQAVFDTPALPESPRANLKRKSGNGSSVFIDEITDAVGVKTVPPFQAQVFDPWMKRPDFPSYAERSQPTKKRKIEVSGKDARKPSPGKVSSAVVLNNHKCMTLLVNFHQQCHSPSVPGIQVGGSIKEPAANQKPPSESEYFQEEDIHTSASSVSSGFVDDFSNGVESLERCRLLSSATDSGASVEDKKDSTYLPKFHFQDFESVGKAHTRAQELQPRVHSKEESVCKVNNSKYREIRVFIEYKDEDKDGILEGGKKEKEETPRNLKEWFKYPTFYKVSFAFMCTRVVENTMYAYFPLYLVDTLKFDKAAIAYLPLVVLISGLFASIAAKKLNKVLGSKWTYCMACLTVMTGGAWFYILPVSYKHVVYAPASLLGGGCCVMFVTSMALVAEMLKDNKMSSATVFNSMTLQAKVATGASVVLTQQFYPKNSVDEDASGNYVRHVFALLPGIAALFGLFAVVMFIPASVKCRKVAHTTDAGTQTDGLIFQPNLLHSHAVDK